MMNEKGYYFGRLAEKKLFFTVLFFMLILVVCILGMSAKSVYAGSNISVTIDGKTVVLDETFGKPFIDTNSRTLVPFRGVMEEFGGTVTWDNENRIAIVEKNGTTVQAPIDQKYILVNGQKKDNDTAAVIKDERTYLPIRAVLEAFGAGVAWDNANRIVVINTDGTVAQFEDSNNGKSPGDGELNAMWISYLEYMSRF